MPPPALRAAALVCYLAALAGTAAFALFVLLQGADLWPFPPLVAAPCPWCVDLAWLAAFALSHSGMAREGFKRLWTRVVPARLERSLYAGLSGFLLLALPLVWQSLPGKPWWRLPAGLAVVPATAGLGLALVNLWHDHAGLFGLRQAWGVAPAEEERLIVSGPYRYVRHPLMACLLVFLWAQPVMRPESALLAGGLSAYILAGIRLEERDLERRFHPHYAEYGRRVPMLLPWRRPAREAEVTP
jgi:protein-S-isoprenylcysteine O-methyltransferase Ste14